MSIVNYQLIKLLKQINYKVKFKFNDKIIKMMKNKITLFNTNNLIKIIII